MAPLFRPAPAKVNLSLRVLDQRADGRHELASLVAFAAVGDRLALTPGANLELSVEGPTAAMAGAVPDNLVLTAARALAERINGLKLGRFELMKYLPAGAGLGGGSTDAAAALQLLAEANGLAGDDPRLLDAARTTGADVPVCLDPKARLAHGIGEVVSRPLGLPKLDVVIVFPGVPLSTAEVFRHFDFAPGERGKPTPYRETLIPRERQALIEFLQHERNDLERPARALAPVIAAAQELLDWTAPQLIRMSGSGSAVFGIYEDPEEAEDAAEDIRSERADWWVVATTLN